jgi:hypothetical protein
VADFYPDRSIRLVVTSALPGSVLRRNAAAAVL